MQKQILVLLGSLFLVGELRVADADSLEVDASILQPYVATYSYHRPETAAKDGVHVTWELVRDEGCRCWRTVLTTHGDTQEFTDANEFDLVTLQLKSTSVPTQLEDGAIADIELEIKGGRAVGSITPRDEGDIQQIDHQLGQLPLGGGADLIMPTLPLEPGFETSWYSLDGQFNTHKVMVVVEKQTTAELQGKSVPMWVIRTDDGKTEFHVVKQPPYVLKRIFRPDGENIFLVWDFRYFGAYQR